MSLTTPSERLVMMANQIARAFAAQGQERAVAKTAEHIKAFWDPRMRRKIDEHVAAGGAGLEPYALAALQQLLSGRAPSAPPARDSVPSAAEHRDDRGTPSPACPDEETSKSSGSHWWQKLPGFSRHTD